MGFLYPRVFVFFFGGLQQKRNIFMLGGIRDQPINDDRANKNT